LGVCGDLEPHPGTKGFIYTIEICYLSYSNKYWNVSHVLQGKVSMFTDGEVGWTVSRLDEQVAGVIGEDYHGSQNVPVVILIGPETNGQPEIFAASMQVMERATLLGLPMPGLVEGAQHYALPDGSQLTLATVTFVPSNGEQIGIDGVQPDIRVDAYWEAQLSGDDEVIEAALNYIRSNAVE
jgi:C-terminal processing protease CtpA/Prc